MWDNVTLFQCYSELSDKKDAPDVGGHSTHDR